MSKPIDTKSWIADEKAFNRWFRKQKYSFGATPGWTQIAEMQRVWCIAAAATREQMNKAVVRAEKRGRSKGWNAHRDQT